MDLEAFGGIGYSFGYINQGISSNDWTDFPWAGQRSLRNFSRDFTGVSVKSDSIKDRLEIREVNLFTGEPNRNVNQNIVPIGAIGCLPCSIGTSIFKLLAKVFVDSKFLLHMSGEVI